MSRATPYTAGAESVQLYRLFTKVGQPYKRGTHVISPLPVNRGRYRPYGRGA